MSQVTFSDLNLIEPIRRSLKAENYSHPTPIQAQSIPHLLEGGDLLGCAQTGTGKTAAFALPLLQRLHLDRRRPQSKQARSLVLTPTRELAIQIAESFEKYGSGLKLKHAVIFGGVGPKPQIRAMSQGVDVLIATPGRLIDLMNQGFIKLDEVQMLVLDEADRMLDMGFIRDVQKILSKMPSERQTLLFSATMPKEVAHLADSVLSNPIKVEVNAVSSTAELIDDKVLFVSQANKSALLLETLREQQIERVLVFTRTKHRANRLAKLLNNNKMRAEAIHGNKAQNARQKALNEFATGRVKILVATDIVARGIDVTGITHVINYEIPNEPASYVHRIGRTARAGTSGEAISFCDTEEIEYLIDIEKLLGRPVEIFSDHTQHSEEIAQLYADVKAKKARAPRRKQSQGRSQRQGGQRRQGEQGNRSRNQGNRSNTNNRRRPSGNRRSSAPRARAAAE